MKAPKVSKKLVFLCAVFLLADWPFLLADTQARTRAQQRSASAAPTPADIVQFVRDRFEWPPTVKIDAQPVNQASFPRFYQTAVTVDDGKQKSVSNVFITTDARCFVYGNIFALTGASNAEIVHCVRAAAKLPATAEITVGPFASSPFPDFLQSTVTIHQGTKVQSGEFFVTRDRRTGILGLVLPFRRDFVEQLISTKDQPSVGTANARVTIVEYADLECPSCARFQKFLETEFLPRYGSKVRIIFKEFPLPSHVWSTPAAIANECGYMQDPSKFLNYRTLIFGNQETINATNVREQLLHLAATAGLNAAGIGSCLDAKASMSRIEACRKEVETLRVFKTPTFFVNGRIVIGIPPAPAFYAIVDEAMAGTNGMSRRR
jgi:protein-disulfide isomerase